MVSIIEESGGDRLRAAPSARAGRSAPRRPLPGGRAVLGGLLVAAAAVGTFAVSGLDAAGPSDRYVVAVHDVAPGRTLTPADLTTVAIDLPGAQRASSFTDLDLLTGAVTLGSLRAGQLVASSDVARSESGRGLVEMSVPVEPARAMNGDRRYLRGGDRVDVVATVTSAGKPTTTVVATGAEVVEVLEARSGIGAGGTLTVVLALRPADAPAVAGASAGSSISLVRTTGTAS